MNFGSAAGGRTPLKGSARSMPVQPLTFDVMRHVTGVSIWILIERF